MDTITLKVKNKKKLTHLLAFLKDLDFVEVLQNAPNIEEKESESTKANDFFELAGIWKDRDITAEELRTQAWPSKF